jgi:hypothetical protein
VKRDDPAVLTERLERYVRRVFPEWAVPIVLEDLAAWRIPYEDEPPSERLLAAVVLLADGDADGLRAGFALGEVDWRDLLVAAGLAHGDWPDELDRRLG